jgi:tryptophan-rich sensory protein
MRGAVEVRYTRDMLSLLDRPDRRGLLANVAGALGIVMLLNGLIFGLGWEGPSGYVPSFLPPPIVIGLVWIGLFPCMALSRWELNRAKARSSDKAGIVVVFALCATYPFYTGGLKGDLIGEVANVTLFIMAATLVIRYTRHRIPRAAAWIVPLLFWLGFASVAQGLAVAHVG